MPERANRKGSAAMRSMTIMVKGATATGDRSGVTRAGRRRPWWGTAVTLLAATAVAASAPVTGPTAVGAAAGPSAVAPAPVVEPLAPLRKGENVEALQRLLSVLGYYAPDRVDGVFSEETAYALKRLQRAHGLAATGELDPPTLHLLGDDGLDRLPRFSYTVRPGDRLSLIASRFGSSLPWIARLNPHLQSVHTIAQGEELLIPIDFPLPRPAAAERMQVLRDRFLGSYLVGVPFTDATALVDEQLEALRAKGFDATLVAGGVEYGITLRGRGVVLGRMEFSAAEGGAATRMDVGLLFSDDPAYEEDLLGGM